MGYTIPRIFYITMSCINNIVSLGYCEGEISTSGLTLMQAAGMSPINADKIATELYRSGYTLLQVKKGLAEKFVRNDFIGVLKANKIASIVTERTYDSSLFNIDKDMGTYAGYRGVKLHSVGSTRGGLKKLKIKAIQCYPLVSGDGVINIIDYIDGVATTTPINVTFVANVINTFTLPEPYVAQYHTVAVVIDNTTFHFASAKITCKTGCGGTKPNDCGWCNGYDGSVEVKNEGYGINVQFVCDCDYDQLLCDFSQTFIGELIWLKMQILVFDEQVKTNRFNSWVTYNREEIRSKWIPDLERQYNEKFNSMVGGGMFEMLRQYKDPCLNCRGIRTVSNV